MRRSTAILIVAGLMMAALPAGADLPPGGTFGDDNGSVHEAAIEAIAAEGITRGCNPPANDRFCPTDRITRGQMAAFLARALNLTAGGASNFVDTSGSIFAADIDKLATAGITRGCNPPANNRFCPDSFVTRGQMGAFLVRAFQYAEVGGSSFVDTSGSIFAVDIDKLATAGITRGCNPPANNRFCPDDHVTREQMASFLQRGLGLSPIQPPAAPGNPSGNAPVPVEARAVDTSNPDRVIGNGTPASCTSQAVVNAVAQGGIIVFNCGPDPVTINMTATASVFNNRPDLVLDGGGLVTLNGMGQRRILYMNTCDQSLVWTTPHCHDQDHPTLTVQNLTFINGRASGSGTMDGGGAIFVRGGRFKVVNSRFFSNRCASTGPDVGGAAIQVFSQYQGRPVFVVNSTFGGQGDLANVCSNGGAISSIGVSWTILNSLFFNNEAIGWGANPAQPGTPGGGNGGAIYNDGNEMTLTLDGTRIEKNFAPEGGSAIFFVSNNRTGNVVIRNSVLTDNPRGAFQTHPGIFFLGNNITFPGSTVE